MYVFNHKNVALVVLNNTFFSATMKANTHGSLFSQFTSHLLWMKNRNALSCSNMPVQPCFTEAFLGLDVKELHVKVWEKVWDGHVTHIIYILCKASRTFGNCQGKLYLKPHLRK